MSGRPKFILLITGSRDAVDAQHCEVMRKAMESVETKVPSTEYEWHLYHGDAPGADSYCAALARTLGWCKPEHIHPYPADWNRDGRAAGPIRNVRMVDRVRDLAQEGARTGCLAFPAATDLKSNHGGTLDCVRRAKQVGIAVHTVPLDVAEARARRLARQTNKETR